MARVFRPERLGSLDNPLRRFFMPPEKVLERLGVRVGDVVIDIGAGSGYFTLPASEVVGSSGAVLAVDVSPEAIAMIERKCAVRGRRNVHTVLSFGDAPNLPEGVGSVALLYTVLHEVDDKPAMLRSVFRSLAAGGRIALVEFARGALFGPPRAERLDEDTVVGLLAASGFCRAAVERWNPLLFAATAFKRT